MSDQNNKALKTGWRRVKLGDVVENVNDFFDRNSDVSTRYVAGEHIDDGDLIVRRWGMMSDDLVPPTFNRRFQSGDVLFHSRNLGKLAVPSFDGVTGEKLFVLRTKDESKLLQGLLPFLLQTTDFLRYVDSRWSGSTNKFLNKTPLMAYEMALPPIEDQLRQLGLLKAWHQVLHSIDDAAEAAAVLRKAVVTHLYENGTNGEQRQPTAIGCFPESWEIVPLGSRYEVQLGKMVSEVARSGPGKTRYLRNANVQWNKLELEDVAEMAFDDREKNKFSLRHGDILACEGRHVGKAAMWRDEIPGACYQKALHRLRRLSPSDEPRYLLHCLRYYSWNGRFVAVTGETTIPHLPAERFRAMLFPFPPKDEQVAIADVIDELDREVEGLGDRRKAAQAALSVAMVAVLGECCV